MALASFVEMDKHYTYTAISDDTDDDDVTPEIIEDSQNDENDASASRDEVPGGEADSNDDDGPHFANIV